MKKITTITLPKNSGKKVIADSKLFIWIDSDFKNWKADEKGKPTEAMDIDVFEMDIDATFAQMMSPDNLMTQEQILVFIEKYRDLLRQDGYATFFPFKSNGEVFVAGVSVGSGGLRARVRRLSCGGVWGAGFRHRVVVPATKSSDSLSEIDTLTPGHYEPSDIDRNIPNLVQRVKSLESDMKKIKKLINFE